MSESPFRLLSLVSIFLCVFLIITITTTDLVAGQRCRPDQTEILTRFKNEFAFSISCSDDADVRCDNVTGAITVLELPGGCLRGSLGPNSSLFELRQLRYLNISFNNFDSSSISSAFGQLNNLQVLILSSNGFTGQFPSSIRNLTKLTYLNLAENKLIGELAPLVKNLTNLQALDLSDNQFSGTIPSFLPTMPFLTYLHLEDNHLTGSFQIQNSLSKLENLYLGNNHFKAEIINPVLKLVNLQYLSLSFLNISQPIDLPVFSSLKSLSYLEFSGNSLTPTSVNSYTGFPENLKSLVLSRCNISEVPGFLKSLKNFGFLVLSDNIIKGNVPDWLWSMPRLVSLDLVGNSFTGFDGSLDHVLVNSSVQVLDLALNSFKGSFPNPPHSIIYLSAWNNSFTGDILLSTCNRTSLRVFDLSYNNFTGLIPPCLSNFTIVNLRKNNLEGEIPDKFYSGSLTQTLDVGYNLLTGKLPRSLMNCSLLRFLSVDHNRINDSFPFWLKALPNLKVLTLRSNMFHGPISPPENPGPLSFPELRILEISDNRFTGSLPKNYFENWRAASLSVNGAGRLYLGDYNDRFGYVDTLDLQYKGLIMEQGNVLHFFAAIDFSGNKLEGEIPESIGLLKALKALNLSNNSFSGHIPVSFANLTGLESLDLSRNKLSGEIPQELRSLTFLSYMDVSYNQLTGEIPQGTQISGLPNSSFEGNPGLCGKPLEKSCFSTNTEDPKQELEEEEEEEEILNWRAVVIAYGPGVLFGLAIGHVFALYKPEWCIKNNVHNRLRGIRHP